MRDSDNQPIDHSACREREFELLEHNRYLKGQITYLQEELADTENKLNEVLRKLQEIDENGI